MGFLRKVGTFVADQYEIRKQKIVAEKARREKEKEERVERERQLAISREFTIRSFYNNRLNNCKWTIGPIFWKEDKLRFEIEATVSRALSSMTNREVEILKYAELFNNFCLIDEKSYDSISLSIAYNDGGCEINVGDCFVSKGFADKYSLTGTNDYIRHYMNSTGMGNTEAAISHLLSIFSSIEKNNPHNPIVIEFRDKIIGGSKWLGDYEIGGTVFSRKNENSLFIGATEQGNPVWFGHEGSLVSIAPPGSGKTQCHVFPNLLSYNGPAVVLDIKGECYEMTNRWRQANIGPVFKFSPLTPNESAKYNPLAMLSDDPDLIWEECRLMADLLIIPSNSSDPTWENRARDIVAGIMAWLVVNNPPEKRSMAKVIDIISKVGWEKFVEDAKLILDIPAVSRLGNSLAVMPEKQLEGVLDAARRHLAIWEGNRVERVTASCDWTPEILRDGSNATIYICIPPNEIETYSPLLRVLLAQHLRHLISKLPESGSKAKQILFMLDEMPRLGPMKPIEEALEVGRQYGIKLWMFAQSLGQLQNTYPNAEGMVGSCAVRIFMNPSSHDGTAKKLSEELGYIESIIDGSRQLMVEANDLSGPDYENYQLVFARNTRPAKLKKVFAYANPEFSDRLGNLTL